MNNNYLKIGKFTLILFFPLLLTAQKDVTQFLGISIDGTKSEMIKKLQEKGFELIPNKKDVLVGEFNGTDVNIHIVTNNNKVCRLMVADVSSTSETDIKIRFNKLVQQFQNNKKYISLPDSTISKYLISEEDDISYQTTVKAKRYQAIFYQKPLDYDTLQNEFVNLFQKDTIKESEKETMTLRLSKMIKDSFNKVVWFMIIQQYGKYSISIYYDNEYNRANGDSL